jgi:xylulokinase
VTRQYQTSHAFRTHYAGLPETYSLETVILGGTYTIRWFVEQFGGPFSLPDRAAEEVLEGLAREVPPGAEGLMLVPYWNTVLNPYWDAGASGIVVGWRGRHSPAHLYRAILEGIAYEQRLATEGVEQAVGGPIQRYIAFGGGARSPLWCQVIADITGKPVHLAHAPEATALGAGILAAAAAGLYPDIAQAAQAMTHRLPQVFLPDPQRSRVYDRFFEVYTHLFPALQPHLDRLTELSESEMA